MNAGRTIPLFALALACAAGAGARERTDGLVFIAGGPFRNPHSNYFGKLIAPAPYRPEALAVRSFYLGRYAVTQREWAAVMGSNPSQFKGGDLPVENVSWYDCIEYLNRRSLREGLTPYYTIDRTRRDPNNTNDIDPLKWTVSFHPGVNGYRLPMEIEWEYAASGGQKSRDYLYPGGNQVDQVAWYWQNSGDRPLHGYWTLPAVRQNHCRPHPVGAKAPNELGLYDMAGNVRQWCWNWYGDAPNVGTGPAASAAGRVWRGGGWMGGDFCCAISFRASFEASGKGPDQGLRVCRNP